MKSKKGISLIVLVITIVVMIVLAAAIILALSSNGTIERAQQASFVSDIKVMEEELNVYIADKISQTNGIYDKTTLYATKSSLEESGEILEGKTIKNVLKSISDKYLEIIEIRLGKLAYVGENINEAKWLNEVVHGVSEENLLEQSNSNGVNYIENSESLSLIDYKLYGNSIQPDLPYDYQPVEYIASTGT